LAAASGGIKIGYIIAISGNAMASIQVNGAALEWQEQGKGKPVLFVHGSVSDYRTWENQVALFAKQ
jgi:pimeloyl-ACP methyl ester carboxylesterase